METTNALDRLREQRAARLLELLQSDLHAQIRVEEDAAGRRRARDARARRQDRIARLEDPAERQKLWNRGQLPSFEGIPIQGLPKSREFWGGVDLTEWTKRELDVACELLDLPATGKKHELIAKIQDWVLEPELEAQRRRQDVLDRKTDVMLGTGRVFSFGSNFHGELGLGHREARDRPTEVTSLQGSRIVRVESGFDADFAFAIAADGRVFAWGGGDRAVFSDAGRANLMVQLSGRQQNEASQGRQDAAQRMHTHAGPGGCFLMPTELPELSVMHIRYIACGRTGGHVAFVTNEGKCFTWGRGEYGELGADTQQQLSRPPSAAVEPAKKSANRLLQVGGPFENTRVVTVSVGNAHSVASTDNGKLYAWGANWSGQLGVGNPKRAGVKDKRMVFCFPSPTLVEALSSTKIARVSCGAAHTAVVSADGQLFTFGCGDGGRLGLGSNDDASQPQLVASLTSMLVLDVCCGSWHSLCLAAQRESNRASSTATIRDFGSASNEGGYVYSFGSGLQGQLGLGKQKSAALPTCIPTLQLRRIRCRAIATSSHHCCALAADGNLYTWGENVGGCLGRKSPDNGIELNEPDVVDPSTYKGYGVGPIVSIAAGRHFTVFATSQWEAREEPLRMSFQLQGKLNQHRKF